MKKLYTTLLAGAALFIGTSAYAQQTLYLIGDNVDGQNWALGTNQMAYDAATGIYSWSGSYLGNAFKINDGTWDPGATNIGAGEFKMTLGTPMEVYNNSDTANVEFVGLSGVSNPIVTLNINSMMLTVTGDGIAAPDEITYYVIGNNVDGQNWALGTNPMTKESEGIYVWKGQYLGTGFKINDGTWAKGENNLGASGSATLSLDVPFSYNANSNSGNIEFEGFSEVISPVVTLNTNDKTITVSKASSPEPDQPDDPDAGVTSINADLDGSEVIYNLQGVRVNRDNAAPGIYIVNGKKTVLR